MIKTSLIYNLYNLIVLRKIFMSWSPKDGGDESPWGGNEKKIILKKKITPTIHKMITMT